MWAPSSLNAALFKQNDKSSTRGNWAVHRVIRLNRLAMSADHLRPEIFALTTVRRSLARLRAGGCGPSSLVRSLPAALAASYQIINDASDCARLPWIDASQSIHLCVEAFGSRHR